MYFCFKVTASVKHSLSNHSLVLYIHTYITHCISDRRYEKQKDGFKRMETIFLCILLFSLLEPCLSFQHGSEMCRYKVCVVKHDNKRIICAIIK